MKLSNTTLRELYLYDLEFTGDPEHGRATKVRNINQWSSIPLSVVANGSPRTINLNDPHNVFVWSDVHFGHKNIMKYAGRPYPTWELMNECLIGNYLNVVQPNDVVIFVGDTSFMSDVATRDIINKLPGYKVTIVGNHDIDRKGNVKDMGFDEQHVCLVVDHDDTQLLFTHYPLTDVPDGCINVHGHIHQHPAPSPKHVNVCVEHTNYAPKLLKVALGL